MHKTSGNLIRCFSSSSERCPSSEPNGVCPLFRRMIVPVRFQINGFFCFLLPAADQSNSAPATPNLIDGHPIPLRNKLIRVHHTRLRQSKISIRSFMQANNYSTENGHAKLRAKPENPAATAAGSGYSVTVAPGDAPPQHKTLDPIDLETAEKKVEQKKKTSGALTILTAPPANFHPPDGTERVFISLGLRGPFIYLFSSSLLVTCGRMKIAGSFRYRPRQLSDCPNESAGRRP